MRLSKLFPAFVAMVAGALMSLAGASIGARLIESTSEKAVQTQFTLEGIDWASVTSDGLQIVLEGTAPTEIAQLTAQRVAGRVVDPARVLNVMNVAQEEAIAAPEFSIEILRNDNGISLIGLVPKNWDKEAFIKTLKRESGSGNVADLMEQANYPVPENWEEITEYSAEVIGLLPRSKLSLNDASIRISGLADSNAQKAFLETALARSEPKGIVVTTDIAAPRPVISPFTVRFLMDETGAKFDACAAETPAGHARILATARALGVQDPVCTVGLGAPSARWANAVEESMRALAKLGKGAVTLSDNEITFLGAQGQNAAQFDKVAAELEADLPAGFRIFASYPKDEESADADEAAQFVAVRSPEGQVQLRGKLQDERSRAASEAIARAHFGSNSVYSATRLGADLPSGWSERVLATLEALALLAHGSATMTADNFVITGETGQANARAEISRLLADKLGEGQQFKIDVAYVRKLDPVLDLPNPQECVARANEIIAEAKIVFAPGSTDVDETSFDTLDSIAAALKDCEDTEMEIGGHTDSQGGEEMNQNLSQSRANSVLDALLARRVAGVSFTAKGYGETLPIADNETEEGREANRRIEFKLLGAETEEVTAETEDLAEQVDPTSEDASESSTTETATEATE